MSPEAFNAAGDVLACSKLADGELFSCDCHLVKPDIEIYRMLLDKYSLCASECVFLDDKQENVDGAEACGILGIVFTNLKEAVYKLNCMGIEFDYEVE